MGLADVLALRSAEADLLCYRQHVFAHPDICPDGCVLVPSDGTVAAVVPVKDAVRVEVLAEAILRDGWGAVDAIQVEDGWLIDGHHRVAAAVLLGLDRMPVRSVVGALDGIRFWHRPLV